MAVYLVSGRLGSGKTLASVGRIRDALLAGRPVATNLDLKLEKLLPAYRRDCVCYRLPDHPSVDDFLALGSGNDTYDELNNGLIVLDELATWLNARAWADKSRVAFLDWIVHSRKYGWDIIFIAQHIEQIDKQLRVSVIEYAATCRRLDRMQVPVLTPLLKFLTLGMVAIKLPKLHIATVRYGCDANSPVAERWAYQGGDLYDGYDTRQVFSPAYSSGLYQLLSPWHIKGRFTRPTFLQRVLAWCRGVRLEYAVPSQVRPGGSLNPADPLALWLKSLPDDRKDAGLAALRKRGYYGLAEAKPQASPPPRFIRGDT